MPQGDYDEALKRALYISAEWLKIFNTGKEGCRVVGMLMQDGWDAAATGLVRFYYTKRLHKFDFLKPKKYGYNVTITV